MHPQFPKGYICSRWPTVLISCNGETYMNPTDDMIMHLKPPTPAAYPHWVEYQCQAPR